MLNETFFCDFKHRVIWIWSIYVVRVLQPLNCFMEVLMYLSWLVPDFFCFRRLKKISKDKIFTIFSGLRCRTTIGFLIFRRSLKIFFRLIFHAWFAFLLLAFNKLVFLAFKNLIFAWKWWWFLHFCNFIILRAFLQNQIPS